VFSVVAAMAREMAQYRQKVAAAMAVLRALVMAMAAAVVRV
jgi:hypothetical protein